MKAARLVFILSLAFLSIIQIVSCSLGVSPEAVGQTEPALGDKTLLPYPADSAVAGVNPPGFCWTAHEKASAYRFLLFRDDSSGAAVEIDGLKSTVAVLDRPLAPGGYHWQVLYLDSAGKPFGRSKTRAFTVGPDTPELLLPDVAELSGRLAGKRPRLYFQVDGELERRLIEEIGRGEIAAWGFCLARADAALAEPLYEEPAPYKDGKFEVGEWRRIYTPGKRGGAHALRCALAWRLTGDRKYLEGARRWLLLLASWDPDGITSYNLPLPDGSTGNDEAGMPMLERMALAYDWVAPDLSAEDRQKVLESLRRRGNQIMERYRKIDFISQPWSNHDVRVLAFLGTAAVSCLGEFPEAADWLDYVLRCYLTSYPTWGSDDGGWAQGLSYWSAYVGWHTNFLEALRSATGIDLYRKPFFRHNGWFAVYFHPPYAKRGGFGDNGQAAPNRPEKLMLLKYANALQDPVLYWQSDRIMVADGVDSNQPLNRKEPDWLEWFVEDVFSVLTPKPAGLVSQSPAGLPGSKWLRDIGWVAMHSALGDSANDVWALFKSSRYGSFSHSHADQNSFQLNAYGEPLIIDSGYYPWFDSPHHDLWTRQTWAHNAVLVHGRGQGSSSMAAAGRIESFEKTGRLTLALGDATAAYNVPMRESTVEQWHETLKDLPLPPAGPKATAARRAVAFAGQGERAWLAVSDYVAAESPTRFQFLLHSLEKMELDEAAGSVTIANGQARCLVKIISNGPLAFSQNDRFLTPPEERYAGAANQWHFSAETKEQAPFARFLAVMVPFRAGEPAPEVKEITEGALRGFEVNGERVSAWWSEGETGTVQGYEGPGRLFVKLEEEKYILR